MDTQYIYEFSILAKHLNFSQAAAELYISQSSLSKHIKTLEKELGVELFIRSTRRMALSAAGNAFLPYAQRITALVDGAQVTLTNVRDRSMADLVIGVIQNPQYYGLSKYMIRFRDEFPDATFSLIESDEAGLLDMFKRRYFNLFTAFHPDLSLRDGGLEAQGRPPYHFLPMVKTKFVAMFQRTAEHPILKVGSAEDSLPSAIALQDLAEENLLLPAHDSTISNVILSAFHDQGITPRIVYEGSSSGSMELVQSGLGVALHSVEFANYVEAKFMGTPEHDALVILPIEPALTFTYGIGYRDLDQLTPQELQYLEHMRRYELAE